MEDNIFDNPARLNHYQVFEGMRASEPATRPSVYISCLKLRKAFKTFTDVEMQDLYDEELGILGLRVYREKLSEKLEEVHDWQLFYALYLLINEEGAYEAAKFIINSKYEDISPFEDEYELYEMICRV
jgi:hypothetical protein